LVLFPITFIQEIVLAAGSWSLVPTALRLNLGKLSGSYAAFLILLIGYVALIWLAGGSRYLDLHPIFQKPGEGIFSRCVAAVPSIRTCYRR
jgi:hypothetical protein